jgi:hypothetical protein
VGRILRGSGPLLPSRRRTPRRVAGNDAQARILALPRQPLGSPSHCPGHDGWAYREFLQVGVESPLPDPSSLCYFRGRLGVDGFRKVFRQVIAKAREQGLVKDRLRLKDASHVIANIAVPTTLALVAQVRDELLAAAQSFDKLRVQGERVNVELLRETTAEQNHEQRLLARVTHLREILMWVDELAPPVTGDEHPAWQALLQKRQLAHKILANREHPKDGDHLLSLVDPEARCGKHGQWYDGYVVDITLDADSRLITELNVLSAGGDEAADAVALIRQEEESHGNDVEALSMDGAGFNGPMLRELEDPDGLAVDVIAPRKKSRLPTSSPRRTSYSTRRRVGCVAQPARHRITGSAMRANTGGSTIFQGKRVPLARCWGVA